MNAGHPGKNQVTDLPAVRLERRHRQTLFPAIRPLLQVDLARGPDAQPVTDSVTSLFALPQHGVCTGTSEAEGVD